MTKEDVELEVSRIDLEIKQLGAQKTKLLKDTLSLFAKFKVGDVLYDRDGIPLGTVTRLYRREGIVEYEFSKDDRSLDNTSRLGSLGFFSKEELQKWHRSEVKWLVDLLDQVRDRIKRD